MENEKITTTAEKPEDIVLVFCINRDAGNELLVSPFMEWAREHIGKALSWERDGEPTLGKSRLRASFEMPTRGTAFVAGTYDRAKLLEALKVTPGRFTE